MEDELKFLLQQDFSVEDTHELCLCVGSRVTTVIPLSQGELITLHGKLEAYFSELGLER